LGRTHSTSALHKAFLVAIGAGGWVALALLVPRAAWPLPSLSSAALFFVVAAGARVLAFPLAQRSDDGLVRISLDSAIFVAAAACLGAPLAALGAGVILTVDALADGLRRHAAAELRVGRSGVTPFTAVLAAIYRGGLVAGLVVAMAWLCRVGWVGGRPDASRAALMGLAFLLAHYLLQSLQLRLDGYSLREALRRHALGVMAEATLLPLGCAIVLIWQPARPGVLVLLGGTYLLVNYGFHRLSLLAAQMRQRARELEVLNRTSQVLSRSLDTRELMPALLEECARVMPAGTQLVALVQSYRSNTTPELERHTFGAAGIVEDPAAARAWLRISESTLDGDLPPGEPGGWRSRVAVPLISYGETLGVLIAQSRDSDAFGLAELKLLEAIAAQAAAAVGNARLYALANIDGLTGLYCRRYFDTRLAEEVERARRFGSSFALIMLDLDDFKRLNDTLGHLGGDRALREVAVIAASQLRGVDLAARYGGEELAFLLPRTSLADAHAVAERIRDAVGTHLVVENGRSWQMSASLGVAGWTESGEGDPGALVGRADEALYRAKRNGKNRVEIDLANFELTPSLAPVRRRRA
jgi:diguanylate cyclase (GGDEF)-like protein